MKTGGLPDPSASAMSHDSSNDQDRAAGGLPLVVDLDGTLIRSDLLIESLFAFFGLSPSPWLKLLGALLKGKAGLKAFLAKVIKIDPSGLHYDAAVMSEIHDAKAQGRKVCLASASNEQYVESVAQHLGVFDESMGSTETLNLSGPRKAARLVEKFGEGGFAYIGNSSDDLAVWRAAGERIAIRTSRGTTRKLNRLDPNAKILPSSSPGLKRILGMLRVHQWAKNGLVGLPLLTAHKFELAAFGSVVMAFFAYSFCASAIYILNDLVDLSADRVHRSKRNRPLAAGAVSPHAAIAVSGLLLVAAAGIATALPIAFMAMLATYFALTTAYSFGLKRKMVVDVIVLAALYTLRVLGGGAAIDVVVSEWLLAFSIFFFLSLGLIKRYVDLLGLKDNELPDPTNRNYQRADTEVIASLAAASGFNAVTVLALWISSPEIAYAYHRPKLLWLLPPLVLYWLVRALMMAHRRFMNDDPVLFALTDRNSRYVVVAMGLIVLLAI